MINKTVAVIWIDNKFHRIRQDDNALISIQTSDAIPVDPIIIRNATAFHAPRVTVTRNADMLFSGDAYVTGMPGRIYPDVLHYVIEAETPTTITIINNAVR